MTWELYVATIVVTTIICYICMDYRIDERDNQIFWLEHDNAELERMLGLTCPACGGHKLSGPGTLCRKCDSAPQSFDEAMTVLQKNGLLHETQN